MIKTYYAIRERGTENYLPILPPGWGWGHSFSEPCPITDGQPRLFDQGVDASRALTKWLKGRAHRHDCVVRHIPVSDRTKDRMEIVPITLEFP